MIKKNIKFLVMDVDGTLTDGKIYMGAYGEVMKAFDIKDGYGIHDILIPANVIPIIITGRTSEIVINRCKELGIEEVHQGIHNKLEKLLEILDRFSHGEGKAFSLSNVAYVGDDYNDLMVMNAIKENHGLVGCPADAAKKVCEVADFISTRNGGNGAVREYIEWILE